MISRTARLLVPVCAAILLGLAGPAAAGDPCPIPFVFHDLGAPPWLDRDALLDGLTSKDSWVGISFSTRQAGVRVDAVSAGSPAEKAGLKVGEHITAVDGQKVGTHEALGERFRTTAPGGTLKLTLADGAEKALTLGRQDPVVGALIDHAAKQECRHVRRGDVDPKQVETLRAKVFFENRRFRCDDAHGQFEGLLEAGDIVIVRGSKRILLANPGWATVCVRANAVDGAKLATGIPPLLDTLGKAYVKDRHDNP